MTLEIEAPAESDNPMLPLRAWPPRPRKRPIYAAVHGAFHLLDRRLDAIAQDIAGLTATEAVVLYSALMNPDQGVFALRTETGFRPSTLNSVLNRLERKRFLRRVNETQDRRYTEIRLTLEGGTYAEFARDALQELDEELEIYLSASQRQAVGAIFEAAAALPRPGRQADY